MAQNKSLEELAKEQQQPPAPPEPPEPPAASAAEYTPDPAGGKGEMVIPFRAAGKEMVLFPMVKEPKSPEAVRRNIAQVHVLVEMLRNPESVLTGIPALSKYHRLWDKAQNEKMLLELQRRTGADMEQLRDPSKRTPEQNECLSQIKESEETNRIAKFWDSRFWQATASLTEKIDKAAQGPLRDTRFWNDAILYFFAKHPEIDATEEGTLSEENIAELHGIFDRMEAYYTQSITGKIQECAPETLFSDFLEHDMQPEQEQPGEERPEQEQPEPKANTKMDGRLFLPSAKGYENSVSTALGENSVGLFCINPDKTKQPLDPEANIGFIRGLLELVLNKKRAGILGNEEIICSLPDFLKQLGITPNRHATGKEGEAGSRAEARYMLAHRQMSELENVWGRLRDGSEYKLIAVLSYNPKTENMGFISPFANKYFEGLFEEERRAIQYRKQKYYLWHCDLLHSTAANEKNKVAFEIAGTLLVGLQQRGLTPDSELHKKGHKSGKGVRTYSITCKGLIDSCPPLKLRLQRLENNSRRTQYLKRTFPAVYKILHEKTDLFKNELCPEPCFTDLKITEIIPTMKTLDTYITITHTGKNPKYKRQFIDMDEFAEESEGEAGKE